ncbi:hypothetical protein EV681_0235 [Advenella incenata]|uniref:Uncharacterized protein n=1 Tax=Advenella incenata TaxID=267800 RepID=A0A4Q7VQI6_9BURK|nr:hypothetical protein EV681_0235 [Advenella incenata]
MEKNRVGQYHTIDLILNQSKKYWLAITSPYWGSQLKYLLIDIKTAVTCIRYKYDKIEFSINRLNDAVPYSCRRWRIDVLKYLSLLALLLLCL